LRRLQGSAGDRLEVENVVKPGSGPDARPPLSGGGAHGPAGRVGYERLGEPPQFAESGETVVFKPGEVHKFWNAGEEHLECTGYVQPADNLEYFLTALFESQRANGGSRAGSIRSGILGKTLPQRVRHDGDPRGGTASCFPGVVVVARLLGKYRNYPDAPEPGRR
jgi:hypothetical protein